MTVNSPNLLLNKIVIRLLKCDDIGTSKKGRVDIFAVTDLNNMLHILVWRVVMSPYVMQYPPLRTFPAVGSLK